MGRSWYRPTAPCSFPVLGGPAGGATYELWAVDTGNLIADYPTEAAARAVARRYVQDHGADALREWALLRRRADGTAHLIAEGVALVAGGAAR